MRPTRPIFTLLILTGILSCPSLLSAQTRATAIVTLTMIPAPEMDQVKASGSYDFSAGFLSGEAVDGRKMTPQVSRHVIFTLESPWSDLKKFEMWKDRVRSFSQADFGNVMVIQIVFFGS